MAGFLHFEKVSKSYGPVQAIRDLTLTVNRGEIFSLLGPSGCGKTTLLRLAAGFERPDSGRVYLDGKDITDVPPHLRKVNTVFQNYALFPHLTVRENVAFGLRVAKPPADQIGLEVDRMLELAQIAELAGKKPIKINDLSSSANRFQQACNDLIHGVV